MVILPRLSINSCFIKDSLTGVRNASTSKEACFFGKINCRSFSVEACFFSIKSSFFASWCVSCRAEHKLITDFSKQLSTPIVGLNYKDEMIDAKKWLAMFGNPYDIVAVDYKGAIGIDWGVYGVPETFVIDKKGIVRYKQIGPVTDLEIHSI